MPEPWPRTTADQWPDWRLEQQMLADCEWVEAFYFDTLSDRRRHMAAYVRGLLERVRTLEKQLGERDGH